jgi:molybdopterin/thiamine biosynthesis adenylyltransferase/rhodanese-related sulfurtransferase
MKVEGNFTKEESLRYSRHFVLPGFSQEAQLKLKNSKVTVVGAGGLGCPVLQYLTAAGVGTITILDFDVINVSNLQRQVLYTVNDIGKNKAEVAASRLNQLNPNTKFHTHNGKIDSANALNLLRDQNLVIDCTDNFPTRYLLNDACVLLNIPLIYGSIFRYEGQVSVFNFNGSANYRDLYATPPEPGSVPDCEEGGVLGVLPGIIGSLQCNEAIKVLTGLGQTLAGKLLLYDSLTSDMSVVSIPDHGHKALIKELIDYDDFCGLSQKKDKTWGNKTDTQMKEITVQELKELMDSKADFQLIDVREPHEYDVCNIGGELIPMADIPHHVDEIAKDKKVVVHCRSGKRSGDMVLWLEKNHGFENLYNLKGGILAWSKEIDPTMPTY